MVIEASFLADTSLRKLRTAFVRVCLSLVGSLLPAFVLFLTCLMVLLGVILPFVLFGFVFVCLGDIWLTILVRCFVFIVC